MKRKNQKVLISIAATLVIGIAGTIVFLSKSSKNEIPYSEFRITLENGMIKDLVIEGQELSGTRQDGSSFKTLNPGDPDLVKELMEKKVDFRGQKPDRLTFWVIGAGRVLLFIGMTYFMWRMFGRMLGFGNSKAKLITEDQVTVRFSDVAGCDEAKADVQELVAFLKAPGKFSRLGAVIPRGVLMMGPPGTGKTLLARAIAGEAKVPFFSVSGSDFVEMYVGVGASRVRDLFDQAKKKAPCIIFIDEIDALGRKRSMGNGGGHDEREQTLNQLLVEMDGFSGSQGIILIAASNRPEILDQALTRPGRFDRHITVNLPDVQGREAILKVHMQKVPSADTIEVNTIAKGTPGFSGADLANLVNEAALFAARSDKQQVELEDLEKAKDKILMGAERGASVMTEEEKHMTAYHEAGHVLVGYLVPEHDPVYKVSIIPRGRTLGMTMFLPERDALNASIEKLESQISSLYAQVRQLMA